MGGHKERAHALLSASSAHRWLACTPSARLEEGFSDDTSEAAEEGTLAHELGELKLRHYFYTTDFGKQKYTRAVNELKKQELWQDEMESHTEEYLDYVKNTALAFLNAPYVAIEKKVDFSAYVPEGFGTADCILISGEVLQVIDFKYGKGVPVNAEGNPQLALYALGAYTAYATLYPIKHVRMSIVQPRLASVSEWECSLKELLAWGDYAKARAALAWEGKGDFAPGEKTCRFCRAKSQCRARSDHNIRLAFGMELPPLISAKEAGRRLLELEDVVKYQKDLQDWALSECLAGKEVPGWKAVEGRGSRDWTDMDAAFKVLEKNGIPGAMLWEKKPATLAQVEKTVGKKAFAGFLGAYVTKKPGKPVLVRESDKRPAITNKISAAEAFKEE